MAELARNLNKDNYTQPDDLSAGNVPDEILEAQIANELKQAQQKKRLEQQKNPSQAIDPKEEAEDYKPYDTPEKPKKRKGKEETKKGTKAKDKKNPNNENQTANQFKTEKQRRRQQINKKYRTLKTEKQRRSKDKGKNSSLLNGAQKAVLNSAKYLPIIGSLICAIDNSINAVSGMAEKQLNIILKSINSLIKLVKLARGIGSIVDSIKLWLQTITALCSTVVGIIAAIFVFISLPVWIIIFTTLKLGMISKALKPAQKKLIKIKVKIKKMILKVRTTKKIDREMLQLRQELKNLK